MGRSKTISSHEANLSFEDLENLADEIRTIVTAGKSYTIREYVGVASSYDSSLLGYRKGKALLFEPKLETYFPHDVFEALKKKAREEHYHLFNEDDEIFIKENIQRGISWLRNRFYTDGKTIRNKIIAMGLEKELQELDSYRKHIGLLGGAFNPVTKGHIELAEAVVKNSDINEVWLVPCYEHLYKEEMEDSSHRLKMCELAVKGHENIKVFDYEIKNKFDGSAYDFLVHLLEDDEFENYKFSYVIGEDNAQSIGLWKNAEELKNLIRFITVSRVGNERGDESNWYFYKPHLYLDIAIKDISSTTIRNWYDLYGELEWELIKKKISSGLNYQVMTYIARHKIYKIKSKEMQEMV